MEIILAHVSEITLEILTVEVAVDLNALPIQIASEVSPVKSSSNYYFLLDLLHYLIIFLLLDVKILALRARAELKPFAILSIIIPNVISLFPHLLLLFSKTLLLNRLMPQWIDWRSLQILLCRSNLCST